AEVLRDLAARDRHDSQREESPLTLSPDAVLIDNSEMALHEQLEVTTEAVLRVLADKQPAPEDGHAWRRDMPLRYRVAYTIFRAMGRFFAMRVHGREHARGLRGFIVTPNHISIWDPPFMAAGIEEVYPLRAIAKAELFRFWPSRMLYRFLDAVPIKRSIYDATAFDMAAGFLEQGENVLFFPEGTRRVFGRPGPVRNGLGMIMQRTGAPALPIMCRGTIAPEPGGSKRAPLEVWIAPPVRLYALQPLRARMSEKEINRAVARPSESISRELLARSCDRHPITDWERGTARRMEKIVRRKDKRIFRRSAPPDRT
ncbi:1-acyl-sn-glycerol-3-phosphate acyltransferase, partial [bacterium]|nr:1-acyl-sn-glycerol-3-phosphate acyltransferase [bacterium]